MGQYNSLIGDKYQVTVKQGKESQWILPVVCLMECQETFQEVSSHVCKKIEREGE